MESNIEEQKQNEISKVNTVAIKTRQQKDYSYSALRYMLFYSDDKVRDAQKMI